MNKKKFIIGSIGVVLVAVIIGLFSYFFFIKQDETSTLTLSDKKWIESNKNTIIDLGVLNNIPVFSYRGTGVLFDFIDDIEENTGLEFNKLSYELGKDVPTDYAFEFVDTPGESDIIFYEDNYSLYLKQNVKYNSLEEIPTMVLGVLSSDLDSANYYLKANIGLQYKTYETVEDMVEAINNDEISGLVLSQIVYFDALSNESFYNAYNITEMGQSLVLHLGSDSKLNSIIKKYSKKWNKKFLEDSYATHFSEMYFLFNNITEQEKTKFKSKSYVYGFVNYAPYDQTINNRLVGVNKEIIKAFAKTANIDVKYKEYDSIEDLTKAFNENKVDFMLHLGDAESFDMDVVETVSVYQETVAIVSSISNNITVNSIASLKGMNVLTVKNSKISALLKQYEVDVKEYDSLDDVINSLDKDSVLAIDFTTYNTYAKTKLKNYRVNYTTGVSYDYGYICRDIEANELFNSYFNFYLSFIDETSIQNKITYKTFEEDVTNSTAFYVLIAGVAIIVVMFNILLNSKGKRKSKNTGISKESKLRYIDMLTSLKNRNYLNDSIAKWDESEIYPQSIIIVDLNNVAYINDNYGHEEGDKVITEAANILIKSQVENTEIIRTNGNEFLIYMVEYEEKQVVAYIRKLNKEFKDLSHGFGAAIGYSMIQDGIKTIDDAINEATLDMRNNKEEANN